jgi:hypothetical protein
MRAMFSIYRALPQDTEDNRAMLHVFLPATDSSVTLLEEEISGKLIL